MSALEIRDVLSWPAGPNETFTTINNWDYNLTTLKHWNYTLYSNNTLSNNSKCYLAFDKFHPAFFMNGSFYNSTNCDIPYYSIRTRGKLNIAFACLFGASIMFTLIHLRKHGRQFLREDKRFRIVGRRWQWYWMCFVAACGLISCITGIDVDRNYIQGIAIVLQSFFYSLMLPGTLAMVWEATRHWGSWQERQIVDRDIYGLPQDDKRSKTEFWLPLIFYLFAWLNFFMVIPRSWTGIEKQNNSAQETDIAAPSATDARMKAGSILALCAWLVICYSLSHSLYHYKPRAERLWTKINTFCEFTPTKIFLAIIVLAIRLAYGIASAWMWEISIFNVNVYLAWPYAFGYGMTILLIAIFEIAGYLEENEDKVLIEQRRQRGMEIDREMGYTRKPNWWSKDYWASGLSPDERLKNMTTEVGGGRATHRHITANLEMGNMNTGLVRNRSKTRPPEDPFKDESPSDDGFTGARMVPTRTESDNVSTLTGQTLGVSVAPQTIRSMLDVEPWDKRR